MYLYFYLVSNNFRHIPNKIKSFEGVTKQVDETYNTEDLKLQKYVLNMFNW